MTELPMATPPGFEPPCESCPKIPKDAWPKHWSNAIEFENWFWDARDWFRECRAIGTFDRPDDLMRAVAATFDEADRREASQPVNALTAAILRDRTGGGR